MSKGIKTKETILNTALQLTSKFGLESLSIGELAKSVGMSKSGLFGHFKSKEKLQIMVLDYAAENFTQQVIIPALKKPRGLPRLEAMMMNWKKWSGSYMTGGCPFLSSIVEYDDRPGNVRDHVKLLQETMIGSFERALRVSNEENQIRSNVDIKQAGYEIYANMIAYHIYSRLLGDKNSDKMFTANFDKIITSIKV